MWERTLLVAAVLLAGCSTTSSPSVETALAPVSTVADSVVITTTPTTTSSPVSATVTSRVSATSPIVDSPTTCAQRFVEALLGSELEVARELADEAFVEAVPPWVSVEPAGAVIDVVVLSNAAGRASVGVGVAFEQAADGTITEPIAYVVDVITGVDGCRVLGVTYA